MLNDKYNIKNYNYIVGFVIFLITTLWIIFVNNGLNLIETCIVRYFLGFLSYVLWHYFFIVKKVKIDYRKILNYGLGIVASILFGALMTGILAAGNVISSFSKRYFILCVVISLIIYIVYLFLKKDLNDNISITLIIFLTGTLFTFSLPIPTGVSWDDQIHFQRCLQISQLGNTFYFKADEKAISQAYFGGATELLQEGEYSAYQRNLNKQYLKGTKVQLSYEEMSMGVAISYIPSVTLLIIGRGLSLPYTWSFLLGRWGNVLFYSFIIFIALNCLKSGKMIVFVISMFPTTLFLMSSYSYDTWGISLSILAYAYFIGILQDNSRKIGYKELFIMCILFMLGFSAKPIYFCMVLILLCVKKDKLKDNITISKYRMIVLITAFLLILSFVAPFLVSGAGGNDMRGGTDVNSMEQIKFILTNPVAYTGILLRFLWMYWSPANSQNYISSFAYLGVMSSHYLILIISIVMALLDKCDADNNITNGINRMWSLFSAFAASVFVATSLYVAFTPVGEETILGCQARYLMPILFIVGYYLGDYRLVGKVKPLMNQKVLIVIGTFVYVSYAILGLYTQCISLY